MLKIIMSSQLNIKRLLKLNFKNGSFLLIGALVASAFAFFIQILLARNLTVENYGVFSAQLTFLNLLTPCIGLGMSSYWLKVYGEDKNNAVRWMPVSLKLLSLTSVAVLIVITINAFTVSSMSFLLSCLFGIHCFGQAVVELSSAKSQIYFDYKKLTFIQIYPHMIRLFFVGLLVITQQSGLENFILAYCVSALIIISTLGQDIFNFIRKKPTVTTDIKLRKLLKNTIPFWLAGFLYLIYVQSAILILNFLDGPTYAGYYSSAFIFLAAIYILPSVIYQKLLMPKLHIWAYHDKNKIISAYKIGNRLMLVIGLIFSILLYLCSDFLVHFIFGEKFAYTSDLVKILAFAIPFKFVSSSVGAILSTKNYMPVKVKIMFVASVFNVIMNFIFVYYFSVKGAAVVTVLTELLLMVLMFGTFKLDYERKMHEG